MFSLMVICGGILTKDNQQNINIRIKMLSEYIYDLIMYVTLKNKIITMKREVHLDQCVCILRSGL